MSVSNKAVSLAEVDFYRICVWLFTRSRQRDAAQEQPNFHVLKGSWEHAGYFFCVWESEAIVCEPEKTLCENSTSRAERWDFFCVFDNRSAGLTVPHVLGDIEYPVDSWSARITPSHTTHNWVQAKKPKSFQCPKIIYHTKRGHSELTIMTDPPGQDLNHVLKRIIGYTHDGHKWLLNDPAPDTPEAMKAMEICTKVPPPGSRCDHGNVGMEVTGSSRC